MGTDEIKVRVRAVIIKNKKLLVISNDRDKFQYLPGGKVQKYETIVTTLQRELVEELGDDIKFTFQKMLYIQEFFNKERDIHSIEFVILGDLNKFDEIEGRNDPEHNGEDHFTWIDIASVSELFKPAELRQKLYSDFQNGFTRHPEYIGTVL
jgi:ADP-ribose pyrophosphatase YjhB (NUDIX family)